MTATLLDPHFNPVLDADVPEKHQSTLEKYRRLAIAHGVPATHAVAYRVRRDFTLKSHAPKVGPCHNGFGYLQGWNFPDDPTQDAFVFWVPYILEGSTSKTKDQQIALLAQKRTELKLPDHHLSSFGNVALVAGLILAHFKATGERVPLNYVVRTDTCNADGFRLSLGWRDGGALYCDGWGDGGQAGGGIGAFVLGVELGS